jgi:hypothetical protein
MSVKPPGRKKQAKEPASDDGKTSPRPWSHHGLEDVYFQRETEVNFWGVMGGLQAAALLTQLGVLWTEMQLGRWYLGIYFVNSLLTIVLGYVLLSWGALVLKEQITIPHILLMFLGNFVLAVQCLLVTNPAGWLAATALAAFFQLLQQVYYKQVGAWEPFSPETNRRFKSNLLVYSFWPLITFAGALHLFLKPSPVAELIWSLVVLLVLIDALFRQHRGMQLEREELIIP